MPIAQRGRGVQGLRYIDVVGVEHIILLAYYGAHVVWDGHVHQSMRAPRATSRSKALLVSIRADSRVMVPRSVSYSEAMPPSSVSGGVRIAPLVATSVGRAYSLTLSNEHNLSVPRATSLSTAPVPVVRTFSGVLVPRATSTGQAFVPTLFADAAPVVPAALSFAQAWPPTVGSRTTIVAPVATATAVAHVPGLGSDNHVPVPRATSTAQAYAVSIAADASISVVVATSASQAHAPEVHALMGFPYTFPFTLG